MNRKAMTVFSVCFLLILSAVSSVMADSISNETLKQYISDLQNSPNDNALREKIIKLVLTMKPAPQISEDARRHFIKAQVFQKEAKDVNGYELAIKAYKQALLLAPWWPEAYNNLGFVLELAGRFDEAISAFKLYIATNPADSRQAQDKIYAIEAKKEMAQVEKTVKKEEKKKKGLEDLVGNWYPEDKIFANTHKRLEMHGNELWGISVFDYEPRRGEEMPWCAFYGLEGNRLLRRNIKGDDCTFYWSDVTVSDDFNEIKAYHHLGEIYKYHRP